MDIEQLSKVQIVLLTLLVSFMTSIATGIVTVSLMDQAPPSVEQTVNRVIERTVQTVAPSTQTSAAVVTQEKTVVVNESDLVAQAVEKATPSIVRLFSSDVHDPTFLGLGVVLDASGTVATDGVVLGENADAVVALSDGSRVRGFVSSRDASSGIAYLRTATSTTDGATPSWIPAALSTSQATLGESVVALSGNTVARIEDGIVTSLIPGDASDPTIIDTSVPESDIMFGSPLINTDGDLVGVSSAVSRASSASGFIPASALAGADVSN